MGREGNGLDSLGSLNRREQYVLRKCVSGSSGSAGRESEMRLESRICASVIPVG